MAFIVIYIIGECMMNIDIEGITICKINNGILIKSEKPLYALANRKRFDFQFIKEFDTHYSNTPNLKRVLVKRNGIDVITSVEFFEKKYFSTISILIDASLDNLTLLNIFRVTTESISTVMWENNAINEDDLSNKLGNYYNIVFVACTSKSDKEVPFDVSLYYEVKELVDEALKKSLEHINNTEKTNRERL